MNQLKMIVNRLRYITAQNPIQIRSQILIRDRTLFPIIAMIRKAGSRSWNNNAIWKLKMPPHSVCCLAPGSRICQSLSVCLFVCLSVSLSLSFSRFLSHDKIVARNLIQARVLAPISEPHSKLTSRFWQKQQLLRITLIIFIILMSLVV